MQREKKKHYFESTEDTLPTYLPQSKLGQM